MKSSYLPFYGSLLLFSASTTDGQEPGDGQSRPGKLPRRGMSNRNPRRTAKHGDPARPQS